MMTHKALRAIITTRNKTRNENVAIHSFLSTHHHLSLVQEPLAACGAATAGDLVVLDRELVVVRDLFILGNVLLGEDHDLLGPFSQEDVCIAVWLKQTKPEKKIRKKKTVS